MKDIDEICEADPASIGYTIFDENGFRDKTVQDHYVAIARAELIDNTPQEVKNLFETAKDVLLYSWFVYRFVPVAELYVYISLEYALKYKYYDGKIPHKPDINFFELLKYAKEHDWIKNEDFTGYWLHQQRKGYASYEEMILKKMQDNNLMEYKHEKSMQDFWKVVSDSEYDYVSSALNTKKSLRNIHAHGHCAVYPPRYSTFEECAEIINAIYSK